MIGLPSTSLAAAFVASAVLLATPAAAVDGEVLINQAAVNAGGITPGDDPGFPATLSRRGKYKLASRESSACPEGRSVSAAMC
jgi:hypothetical protein